VAEFCVGTNAAHISLYAGGVANWRLKYQQEAAKAAEFERWIDSVPDQFQVIAMDGRIFRYWAKLTHPRSHTLDGDAMIAATAAVHSMTVVTRNVRDFEALAARVINPFAWGTQR
jgi:predicted nucleic acid-binding protein